MVYRIIFQSRQGKLLIRSEKLNNPSLYSNIEVTEAKDYTDATQAHSRTVKEIGARVRLSSSNSTGSPNRNQVPLSPNKIFKNQITTENTSSVTGYPNPCTKICL